MTRPFRTMGVALCAVTLALATASCGDGFDCVGDEAHHRTFG